MPPMFCTIRPICAVAKQHVVEKRNQRRTLAARRHIRWTKIRNHRHAHSRGNDRRLTRLPRGRHFASEKTLRLALMIERLSMAADQIRFYVETAAAVASTASE